MNADTLIDYYSGLDETEQRKFDKRYKALLRFRKNLDALAELVNAMPEEKVRAMLKEMNK